MNCPRRNSGNIDAPKKLPSQARQSHRGEACFHDLLPKMGRRPFYDFFSSDARVMLLGPNRSRIESTVWSTFPESDDLSGAASSASRSSWSNKLSWRSSWCFWKWPRLIPISRTGLAGSQLLASKAQPARYTSCDRFIAGTILWRVITLKSVYLSVIWTT